MLTSFLPQRKEKLTRLSTITCEFEMERAKYAQRIRETRRKQQRRLSQDF